MGGQDLSQKEKRIKKEKSLLFMIILLFEKQL